MATFKSSEAFAKIIINGTIQWFTTEEGAEFEVMMLTDEQKEEVELCESYADMIAKAAEYGLAFNGDRAIENETLKDKIELIWLDDDLDQDAEPDSKSQVGIKVCEISGLTEAIEKQLAEEESEIEVDGDSGSQEDIARLIQDKQHAIAQEV